MNESNIHAKVLCPVTDKEDEPSYRVGTLTAINSRYATVTFDDGLVLKVGKTKIELMPVEEVAKPKKSTPRKSAVQDAFSQMAKDKSLDEIYSIASDILDIIESDLRAKYGHLNPGMQRMNLGNRIRGHSKRR
jgi:hypothetical protein